MGVGTTAAPATRLVCSAELGGVHGRLVCSAVHGRLLCMLSSVECMASLHAVQCMAGSCAVQCMVGSSAMECMAGSCAVLGSVVDTLFQETSKEPKCVSRGILSLEGMVWSLPLSLLPL